MKYLIIDDEPIAHRIIEGYCRELAYMEKVGNAYNAFEASAIFTEQAVELIFLDINMPKISGFEWLKTLARNPKVIVTTAYEEYALEGFELDVVDYLLKPFSLARFMKAVHKAGQAAVINPALVMSDVSGVPEKNLFLKGDKKYHHVPIADLEYIEAFGNYSKIFLGEGMILCHEKISTLEELLKGSNVLRVHKSFIVAVNKIKFVQGNTIYLNEHRVPIGQTYRSRVNALISGKK